MLSIVADQQLSLITKTCAALANISTYPGSGINAQAVAKADALLVRSTTTVDKNLLADSKVGFVGTATSGTDHIDLDYLKTAGIDFSYTPGCNRRAVVEYVLSSLFTVAAAQGFCLANKTVGIIGCGQIGSLLKQCLAALGVQLLINDPPLARLTDDPSYVDIDKVLTADIISLHVPLHDGEFATRNLLTKQQLARLKPDAILVNTARAEVINEADLMAFKDDNPAATLILDVWYGEPNINLSLLQQATIATPHIAGYSLTAKQTAEQRLLTALANWAGFDLPRLPTVAEQHYPLITASNSISSAVLAAYNVMSDDEALRQLHQVPTAARARYFENLRKNYRLRAEFADYIIQCQNIHQGTRQQLEQLNFQVHMQ